MKIKGGRADLRITGSAKVNKTVSYLYTDKKLVVQEDLLLAGLEDQSEEFFYENKIEMAHSDQASNSFSGDALADEILKIRNNKVGLSCNQATLHKIPLPEGKSFDYFSIGNHP